MYDKLLELYNRYGLLDYTLIIFLVTCFYVKILDLIYNLGSFLFEKALYYKNKRKELKNNGS